MPSLSPRAAPEETVRAFSARLRGYDWDNAIAPGCAELAELLRDEWEANNIWRGRRCTLSRQWCRAVTSQRPIRRTQ